MSSTTYRPCSFAWSTAWWIWARYALSSVPRSGSSADHERPSRTTLKPCSAMPAKSSSVSGEVSSTSGRGR